MKIIYEKGLFRKKILKACLNNNISLSFIDINPYIEKKDFKTTVHLKEEVFFRLYIPIIFKDRYEKVLYCDTDIIFLADPAPLLAIPLGNNKLAAARDNIMNGIINLNPEKRQYFTDDLAIKNTDDYFNSGVLLFNIPSITENEIADMEQKAVRRTYNWCDQDVLNSYYQGKVHLFSSKWNYISANSTFLAKIQAMKENHKNEYTQAAHDPQIIHYAGLRKPWFYPEEKSASIWWAYARKTVFYGEILCRMLNFQVEQKYKERNKNINQLQNELNKKTDELQNKLNKKTDELQNELNKKTDELQNESRLRFACDHIWSFRFLKWRFWLCKCLSWGQRRDKYRAKYKAVRDLLRTVEEYHRSVWQSYARQG